VTLEIAGNAGQIQANFDLTIWLAESGEGLSADVDFNRDLFDSSTVERLVRHFGTLLAGLAEDSDLGLALGDLPLLTDRQRAHLVREWPGAAGVYRDDLTVTELFHQQAERTPEKVAAVSAGASLSYAELRSLAGRLARRLSGPGRLVGLMSEPGADLLVGMLGILEAGNGFVPLDLRYPGERLAWMVKECGIDALVSDRRRPGAFAHLEQALCVDETSSAVAESSPPPDPDRLAYVIYTSGSTGCPKGVPIAQRELVPMLSWSRDYFGLGESTRALQSLSYAFDFGIFECLTTIVFGGTLHFLAPSEYGDPDATARYAGERRINTLHGTPSFALGLVAAGARFPTLEILHLGGEALAWDQVATLAAAVGDTCVLYNGYGPTEATVNSTIYRVGLAGAGRGVPIGRPSSNHRIYVFDAAGRPLPVGAHGELCVGGLLARGYHLRPRLTAERFVPDPYGGVAGDRLYRTGDRVRHLVSGDVEFLGRFDHQVKVRGFRIELGEVETALRRHPAVEEAVVVASSDDGREGARLVAYVVAAEASPPAGDLRTYLRGHLPEYMVPAVFVTLPELPKTAAGKVNRRALPAPDRSRPELERRYVAPSTESEEVLAEIVGELLGVERVGVHDSFFDLGGHSLLATQYRSRIRESFGVEIPLLSLFETPTVASLAVTVEEMILAELQEMAEDEEELGVLS
jgi:amino acid adenylation domain-containing protein